LVGVILVVNVPDRRFTPPAMYEKFPVNPCSVNESPLGQVKLPHAPVEVDTALKVRVASIGVDPYEVGTWKRKRSWPPPVTVTLVPLFRTVNWLPLPT
jgi:hypothetical protein